MRRNNFVLVLNSIFLIFYFYGCQTSPVDEKTQSAEIVEINTNISTLNFKELRAGPFLLQIPDNWNLLEQEGKKDCDFVIKGTCSDKFCTNLIGMQYDTSSANNFNSFFTGWALEAQLSEFGIEYTSTNTIYHSIYNVKLFNYTFQQNGIEINGLTYIIDIKDAWWVFTFMSDSNEHREKDEFLKTTNKIIKSITIIE